jgi:8-oxo-dGTP pyrophosphatase MutT (NUDIX family)
MPKVACFEIPGLYCWFWSSDHNPPHFHVKREGEWEIKVNFAEGEEEMFELQWGDAPSARVLRDLAKNVKQNRFKLLAECEAKVNK